MFTQMVDTAKREKTEEADKRKKFRSCRSEQPFKYFSIKIKYFFSPAGSSLTRSGVSTGGASCWVCCTTTTSTSTCTAPDLVILASDWSILIT